MDSILINDPACSEALARRAGTTFNPQVDQSFCRVKDGVRLGGVIFSNFTKESIGIHSASWSPHWINRDMLFITFDYPFNQLGVKRIFGQVPESNYHAQEFNVKVGFRYVARIEGVYPNGEACVVMRLDRHECRFLGITPKRVMSNKVVN